MEQHHIIVCVLIILLGFGLFLNFDKKEGLITTTYTTTPRTTKTTLTDTGGLYYYPWSYKQHPWNIHGYYPWSNNSYYPVPGFISDAIRTPYVNYAVQPYLSQYNKPMLTSIVNPKDFIIGQWVKAGIASSSKSKQPYLLQVYQRALDPMREIYEYKVRDRDGFEVPLDRIYLLEDGDTFDIPEYKSKGPFVFREDEYSYVYM